ncbi:carbamoyl phosphate synthase small subunit [Thermomicrobium sp. CFH 73360]|uniref:carbamoyl phosphate synthase small subunit n=1 Tax=Thermomicrobium sp. CFH 73360 TaxID=2951987 RepID=UPI0020771622|nr:carbamoyl phosphate synthase small subunit [Thermomicrobium sp. CFH 73360]MCM8745761.1 carbamoyl phosphate synthase small subunit [Thermomicrobium sp. CFH 73360]
MSIRTSRTGALVLEDGRIFPGTPFGARRNAEGEAVFTTVMTGYQEVVTDPSFYGQIVCMTYPLIGNYGICDEDEQSRRPWVAGLVVREYCDQPSHWRAQGTLGEYLEGWGIPGLAGVDTRALTRHLRLHGTMRAVLVSDRTGLSDEELCEMARRAWTPDREDVVPAVRGERATFGPADAPHVVVIDCGVKHNILASLRRRGVRLTVLPYGARAAEVLELDPDGVVVSPGPGDPTQARQAVETVRELAHSGVPFFGICLGHQLVALAAGAKTTKLVFGHRGGNHPVKDLLTGRVRITSQNHGYCVEAASVPTEQGWLVWMVNVNDGTVEGLRHQELPVLSVQFHPEGAPGPQDSQDLFDAFLELVRQRWQARMTQPVLLAGEGV